MRQTRPRIVSVGPGASAVIQLSAILAARCILRPWGGRGLGRAVEKFASAFGDGNFVVFDVGQGRRLKIALYDAYWMAPILRGGRYEPEIATILGHLLESDSALIDCGANIGYWSVWATRFIDDPKRIIAIEASPLLQESLADNASLNDGAFTPVHRAVWSVSDIEMEMPVDRKRHAWGSLAVDVKRDLVDAGFETVRVATITIDDAIAQNAIGDASLIVLKIDVEGTEIEALRGARNTLGTNVLVIYEDHARDGTSGITKHVIEELKLEVFYCDEESRVIPIPNTTAAGISKSSVERGYNFFACSPGTRVEARLRDLVDD